MPDSVRQLTLPIPGMAARLSSAAKIPRSERVSVNRNLKMSSVSWVGFDMDYTLAIYDQAEMDSLSVSLTVDRLVKRGYPASLARLTYDHRFPIRGLLVDKRLGNILKMDRFKFVRKAYHGMQRLSKETVREAYNNRRIRPHTSRYHWIDTLFSLSEVASYAAIIHALDEQDERIDPTKLFQDVRESIDEAHRDGSFYAAVLRDLDRFIHRDPHLAETLHKFRSAGKKLFLLTNSPWDYTDPVMRYLFDGAPLEYPSWQHFFDVVIVAAQKPKWFQEERPMMMRDGDVLREAVSPLQKGAVYEGGSLAELERQLDVPGSNVLYVGDHIYGDMLRSKKESAWRTAMIIPELGAEIDAHDENADRMTKQRELEEMRDNLEDELRFHQRRFKEIAKRTTTPAVEKEKFRLKRAIDQVRKLLLETEHKHGELDELVDSSFHPYWGSLLKEQNGMSIFGLQVETYADIYMRRVSSLRHYSPLQFFRSPHDRMPHEL